MPDPDHPRIVADEMFGGEPRISGRRITVLDVYERVKEGGGEPSPEEFAETFQLAVADVYAALAYYPNVLIERCSLFPGEEVGQRVRRPGMERPQVDRERILGLCAGIVGRLLSEILGKVQ